MSGADTPAPIKSVKLCTGVGTWLGDHPVSFIFFSDKDKKLTAGSDEQKKRKEKTAQPCWGSNLGFSIAGQTLEPLSYEAMAGTAYVIYTVLLFHLIQLSVSYLCWTRKGTSLI